jgi:hypothetical protein
MFNLTATVQNNNLKILIREGVGGVVARINILIEKK